MDSFNKALSGSKAEWRRPASTTGLSHALDLFDGGYYKTKDEAIRLVKQAQSELAALDSGRDLYQEGLAAFRAEQERQPGEPLRSHYKMIDKGYKPSEDDYSMVEKGDEERIMRWMAQQVVQRCDPRISKEYMDNFYRELRGKTRDQIRVTDAAKKWRERS